MNYEEALKEWGARKLEKIYNGILVGRETVKVSMEFDEGYACCGGRDPYCYCSFAESPRAYVEITSGKYKCSIDSWEFNFAGILKEIVEAGGGTVTGV